MGQTSEPELLKEWTGMARAYLDGDRAAFDAAQERFRRARQATAQRGRVHDYTWMGWGHALHFFPGCFERLEERGHFECLGHGYGIREGHTILLKNREGFATPWIVANIGYYADPPDMFSAVLRHPQAKKRTRWRLKRWFPVHFRNKADRR